MICLPAVAGLTALALPLIATIFFHGGFTENGVHQSTASLIAFAPGLVAIVMVKVLAPGFYARKNTKTPVRIAIISMAANIGFCLLLIYPLRHIGLALATSLAAFVNAVMLYLALKKENIYRPGPGWHSFLLRVGTAAIGMGVLIAWLSGDSNDWIIMSVWERAFNLVFLVTFGCIIYFTALCLMGVSLRALWRGKQLRE